MHFVSPKVRAGGSVTHPLGLLVLDRFHSKTEVSRESGCVPEYHGFLGPGKGEGLG